jgi:hypothetical protein
MRALLALASAVVGAAAACNWQSISRYFLFNMLLLILELYVSAHILFAHEPSHLSIHSLLAVRSSSAAGPEYVLDSIVEKLAQRIASTQPHSTPSVLLFPPAASITAFPILSSVLPLGLIVASSFAVSRYLGSGAGSVCAVAQVSFFFIFLCIFSTYPTQASVSAAVEHLGVAVAGINGNIDKFRSHCDSRFDALQQVCDVGFERIAELQAQVTGMQILQQRQLESNSRLEESMSALVTAANELRSAEARDAARPLGMQAMLGAHSRDSLFLQMRTGPMLRA